MSKENDNYRQKQRMAAHPDDEAARRVWALKHDYTVSGAFVLSELTSNPEKGGKRQQVLEHAFWLLEEANPWWRKKAKKAG